MTRSICVLALLWSFSVTQAAELDGVTLPDTTTVGGKALVLNGLGTRKATIFKKKIYVAGLYLERKERDAAAILASPSPKKVDMKFVYSVDAKKIRETWQESFEKNCAPDCDRLKPALGELLAAMTDLKEGDQLSYSLWPEKVELTVKGGAPVAVKGEGLGRILLTSWLGPNPPNEELKQGMLGAP